MNKPITVHVINITISMYCALSEIHLFCRALPFDFIPVYLLLLVCALMKFLILCLPLMI